MTDLPSTDHTHSIGLRHTNLGLTRRALRADLPRKTRTAKKRTVALAVVVTLAVAGLLGVTGAQAAAANPATSPLPTLTLAMDGNSVTVGGTLQSGAVNVVSTVTNEAQGDPTLILLKPGASITQALDAVNAHDGELDYLDPYGSIVFDAAANQGVSSAQTFLVPGRYAALDGSSSAAIPPYSNFTVTRSADPASLPKPDATITTIDFAFRGADNLHDGELVRFENDGFLVHMALAIPVKNAKSAATATKLLLGGRNKQARKLVIGLIVGLDIGLSAGGLQQEVVTARPGIYVLVCLMKNQDGRVDTQLGMERTIRISNSRAKSPPD